MKKLILIVGMLLFFYAAYSQCSVPSPVSNTSKKISLNGYYLKDVQPMIAYYQNHKNMFTNPKQESFYFDAGTLKKMIAAINAYNTYNATQKIDGIRLYFASNQALSDKKNLFIVLVPTTKGDTNPDPMCPSHFHHNDFFDLNISDPLFRDTSIIHGKPDFSTSASTGVRLYEHCANCPNIICPGQSNHFIIRDTAEHMVANFGKPHKMTTCSEWFDLGFVQDINDDATHTGIRIYFSKHDKNDSDTTQDAKDKEAFIWVTTQTIPLDNGTNNIEMDSFYCIPKTHKALLYTPGGADNGELCPFNCN